MFFQSCKLSATSARHLHVTRDGISIQDCFLDIICAFLLVDSSFFYVHPLSLSWVSRKSLHPKYARVIISGIYICEVTWQSEFKVAGGIKISNQLM